MLKQSIQDIFEGVGVLIWSAAISYLIIFCGLSVNLLYTVGCRPDHKIGNVKCTLNFKPKKNGKKAFINGH